MDLLKLIVQVTRNRHFFNSVNPLPGGLFVEGDWRVFAPLVKGTLSKERGEYPVVPNYRVIDDVVKEPTQPTPIAVINGGSAMNSE